MPNSLISSSSPYLLQHAHNPVNWEPWSAEAFERAKVENKLVIVSIGYSACHWCHVMEHESFEDELVAELMNRNYICIKVDREERPDIDQLFMDAAQLMIGRGGWPLNAFALPDGRPVYAGTYFPKIAWTGLLKEISYGYKKQPEKYLEYASKLIAGIKGLSMIPVQPLQNTDFNMDMLDDAYFAISHQIDLTYGGRGRAPKFPMPHNWLFMLRYFHVTGNQEALSHTLLTLDKMAEGGIYDQIGGGFARYATDQQWKVPHFEKMLYDNAQLLSLYSEAYLITNKELYKQVVYQTIAFMQRELMSENGAFYCALDADSEGVEGKFYVWTSKEIDIVLGDNLSPVIKDWLGIDGEAHWEHDLNIALIATDIETLAEKHSLSVDACKEILEEGRSKLLDARNLRVRPGLDHKILLSWNALAIKGLLDAWKVFEDPIFYDLAKNCLGYVRKELVDGVQLYRCLQPGKDPISGFLEDYSLYIEVLLCWYQTSFEENALLEAQQLIDHTIKYFGDESGLFWFSSSGNNDLAARKIDTSDNVIPSPNSVMAHNLFIAGKLLGSDDYIAQATKMLSAVLPQIVENASFFSNWAILLGYCVGPFYEVVFTGDQAISNGLGFEKKYIPNKLVAAAGQHSLINIPLLAHKHVPGQSLIYLCENTACLAPVGTVASAWELLEQK